MTKMRSPSEEAAAEEGISSKQVKPRRVEFNIRREIELLRDLHDPSIVSVLDFFNDGAHAYLVMELCSGGNLHEHLLTLQMDRISMLTAKERPSSTVRPVPASASSSSAPEMARAKPSPADHRDDPPGFFEKDVRRIMLRLANTVAYMHKNHVAHRDIKLANVLLLNKGAFESGDLRLADFGLAIRMEKDGRLITQPVGTPSFVAPEILAPAQFGMEGYDYGCDVWSLGVCMYLMLFVICPFVPTETTKVKFFILNTPLIFPNPFPSQHVSQMAVDLLRRMLTKQPKERVKIQQVLEHPFFSAQTR